MKHSAGMRTHVPKRDPTEVRQMEQWQFVAGSLPVEVSEEREP